DLGDTVTLFPHLAFDELLAYYSAAALFVLPSPYEPFGLVAVEAMACETAVLATPHGGPPEIIDPGEDGELADPQDAEAFGDALIRLLSDPAALAAMGRRGREKAVAVFDWEAVAAAVAEVYRAAVAAAPR
ncbi:MAG TPA: glycosyltransferase, partial [Gammaproteobacteria bacterium]|nr:glycosyltransferase [Gammaproteobacteria bacterium]